MKLPIQQTFPQPGYFNFLCVQNYSLTSVHVKNALHRIYRRFWCSVLQNAVLWRVLVRATMKSRPPRRLLESVTEVLHWDFTIYIHLTNLDDNGSFSCCKFDIRKESCTNKNTNAISPLHYQMSAVSHTCYIAMQRKIYCIKFRHPRCVHKLTRVERMYLSNTQSCIKGWSYYPPRSQY